MKIQIILNYLLMIKFYLILVNSEITTTTTTTQQLESNLFFPNIDLLSCKINNDYNNLDYNYQLEQQQQQQQQQRSNSNNLIKKSCYRNLFNRETFLDCEGDKNQEFKKIQNVNFKINQNLNLIIQQQENHENDQKTIILEQSFNTFPTGNGSYIINNVNEHIAFFQTFFKIESNIICKDLIEIEFMEKNQQKSQINIENKKKLEKECSNIKLESYYYKDIYGNIFNNNNIENKQINNSNINNNNNNNNNNKEWMIYDKSSKSLSLYYHQNFPFNTLTQLPTNKNEWFKESLKKMKTGKTIPSTSFSEIGGKVISKWSIPNYLDFILLNSTYTHGMGDLMLGGRHIEHNNYKIVEYGFYDIKILNLKTGEIQPFKRKYFSF